MTPMTGPDLDWMQQSLLTRRVVENNGPSLWAGPGCQQNRNGGNMKWMEIFKHENEVAKAGTAKAINDHTDPKLLVAMQLQAGQERHDALVNASNHVIANNKQTEMRLAEALKQKARLEQSIQTAMDHGRETDAQHLAVELSGVEDRVESLKQMHDQTQAAADKAAQALRDNNDEMVALKAKAEQLNMQIDQAAMQHQMADNLKAVTAISSASSPTFADIEDRVQADFALSSAQVDTADDDPALADMHAHHNEIQDRADSILDRYRKPSPTAALAEPPKQPALSSASPTDRLYQ